MKQKLEETKAKLKANSKDAHFADALISDLLSIKGQLSHEPTLVHIPLDDIVDSFSGNYFEMATTKDGTSIYKTNGGYTIIADFRLNALNGAIKNFIDAHKNIQNLSESESEVVLLDMDANAHVLNIPMIAFSDQELKFELASMIVKHLVKLQEEANNSDLQDETYAQDKLFEDSIVAINEIKKAELE